MEAMFLLMFLANSIRNLEFVDYPNAYWREEKYWNPVTYAGIMG